MGPAFAVRAQAPFCAWGREIMRNIDKTVQSDTSKSRNSVRGVAFALIGGSLWGFSGTAVSYLFRESGIEPTWVMSIRMICAGLLFLLLSCVRGDGRPWRLLHESKALCELLLFAGCGLFLNQFAYLMAIQATDSATATVLQSLQLLPVAAAACIIGKRGPRLRELVGMGFAIAGTFLIATGGNPSSLVLPLDGLVFGLLAALGGAGIALFPRRILAEYGVMAVNGWAMLLVGLIAVFLVPDLSQGPTVFSASCWMVFVALVVLGTFCSYLFYMQGVREVGSLKTALLSTAEPVSATILSAVWIGVVFAPTDFIGFVLIIGMMLLVA